MKRMKRTNSRVVPMVTLVVAAAALTLGTAGGADSAVAPVPVLATGRVAFAPGVTSGQVLVFAAPNQTAITKDVANAPLDTPLIASAQVGSDGSFTLRADPAAMPAGVSMPDRTVNLDAVVTSGGRQAEYFFPVTPTVTSAGPQWVSISTVGAKTADLQFDMGTGVAKNAKYDPAKWVNASGRRMLPSLVKAASSGKTSPVTPQLKALAATAGDPVDAVPGGCSVVPGAKFLGRPEHFMNVYDDGSADSHVAETSSSTHTMGVGVTLNGGSWSANGTASISRSASASVISRERQHSWGYYNKVNYQNFANSCTGRTYRSPIGFYDLLAADIDGSVQYQFLNDSCGQKAKGDVFNTTDARSVTFGTGVDIGPLNLSAQSGFGTDENVHYTMLEGGSIRGNSNEGPAQSSKVAASSFPC